MGSGKTVGLNINKLVFLKMQVFLYLDPYWTIDGISLGGQLHTQNTMLAELILQCITEKLIPLAQNIGYPIDQFNRILRRIFKALGDIAIYQL